MAAAVITASASVLVAVLVFIFNQHAQIQQERRQIRLARVNNQLRDLYGPLNALVDVNERIWESLRQSGLPAQEERNPGEGTEGWRRWQDNALMPINRKMRDLIIEHADLLVDTEVPRPLRDFCAHVESVEIIMAAEKRGLRERSLVAHPGASYVAHVRSSFENLKREQQGLLKI